MDGIRFSAKFEPCPSEHRFMETLSKEKKEAYIRSKLAEAFERSMRTELSYKELEGDRFSFPSYVALIELKTP